MENYIWGGIVIFFHRFTVFSGFIDKFNHSLTEQSIWRDKALGLISHFFSLNVKKLKNIDTHFFDKSLLEILETCTWCYLFILEAKCSLYNFKKCVYGNWWKEFFQYFSHNILIIDKFYEWKSPNRYIIYVTIKCEVY